MISLLTLIGCSDDKTGLGAVDVPTADQQALCDAHSDSVFVPGRGFEPDGTTPVRDWCVNKFEYANERFNNFIAGLNSGGPKWTVTTTCTVAAATQDAAEVADCVDGNHTTSAVPVSTDVKNNSPAGFDGNDQPNVMQTWQDAQAACRFEGQELLTEGQWLNAMSGTSGNDTYAVPDGKTLAGHATYNTDHTTNVADANNENSFGIDNGTGNAWERVLNPSFIRGGGYLDDSTDDLRVDCRGGHSGSAVNPGDGLGFRCGFPPKTQE